MALYLTDHQENKKLERITGESPNRFPIKNSATILNQNSLDVDWTEVIDMDESSFILGNPPFGGSTWQTKSQKIETSTVWDGISGSGLLDYVSNWFAKSAKAINKTNCSAAFVSTSSVAQGTHPALMWPTLTNLGVEISFAHQSFNWTNDASGQAAVHCVIVGLSRVGRTSSKSLWRYSGKTQMPIMEIAENINGYLLAAPNVLIVSRKKPLSKNTKVMDNGSKPTDDGFLSNISDDDAKLIRETDAIAAKYLRRILGARELIHNESRNCLWLVDADPKDVRDSKVLSARIAGVRHFREASTDKQTKRDAIRSNEFQAIRQPKEKFLAIPRITSEDRPYVPMAFLDEDVIINDKISFIANCDLVTFGILNSSVFNCWNKAVSGRTRNDTLLSNTITYNNFPFLDLNQKKRELVIDAAEKVLEVRSNFPDASLADLYDSSSMPSTLAIAHRNLDALVLSAYGLPKDASQQQIVERLFNLYVESQSASR
jgi:hypothetical protein